MSGAEVGFVGLILGVIPIIEATETGYDAAKDADGQPEAFRVVAARLLLIIEILHSAEERAQALDETAQEALKPILKSCTVKAEKLENLFQRVRKDVDEWYNRYEKASSILRKEGEVEFLMKGILEDVLVLKAVCERLIGTSFPKDGIVSSATSSQADALSLFKQASSSITIRTHVYKSRTFAGDSGYVTSVAFSPDGKQVVSGSHDHTVRLWDAVTGAALQTLEGHSDYVRSVAFSPDGKQVVSSSDDKTVRLWDAVTGAALQTLRGHSSYVSSVAFSPDGNQIVSGSEDKTVRLWDTSRRVAPQTLKGHWASVRSVAFSPDGKQVVSGSDENTVRLWDAFTRAALQTLRGHSNYVRSVAFSPDGKQVVSGSFDMTVRLWDAVTGAPLQTLKGHKGFVNSVAFSPDGKHVVSGSDDRTVRIWDAITGTVLQTLQGHWAYIKSVAFSPDGKQVVSGSYDKTVRLWDAVTEPALQTLEGYSNGVNLMAFSPGWISKACDIVSQAAIWTLKLSQDPWFCTLPGARALEVVLVSWGLVEPPLEPGRIRIRWYNEYGRKFFRDALVADWVRMKTNRPELLLSSLVYKPIMEETVEGDDGPSGKRKVSTESTQKLGSKGASLPASRDIADRHNITDNQAASSSYSSPSNAGEQKKRKVKRNEKDVELEKWFLICMPRENEAAVKHLPAKTPQVDNSLMNEVKLTYETVRSKWSRLSKLRVVHKIRLRRFGVFVDHKGELQWNAEHDVPFQWPDSADKEDWEFQEDIDDMEIGVLEAAMMDHWNHPKRPPLFRDSADNRGKRSLPLPVLHRSCPPGPLPFYNLNPPPNLNDANHATELLTGNFQGNNDVALTSDEFRIPRYWFYDVIPKKKDKQLLDITAKKRNRVGWGICIEERYSISWVVIVVFATLPTGGFGFALAWCIIHGPTFWGMSSAVTALFMMGYTLWVARMKDSK